MRMFDKMYFLHLSPQYQTIIPNQQYYHHQQLTHTSVLSKIQTRHQNHYLNDIGTSITILHRERTFLSEQIMAHMVYCETKKVTENLSRLTLTRCGALNTYKTASAMSIGLSFAFSSSFSKGNDSVISVSTSPGLIL